MKPPTIASEIIGPDRIPLIIKEEIGGGAFGTVFKADNEEGLSFAVKFPKVTGLDDKGLEAFSNEVQAASKIRHKNVVDIFHVEFDDPKYLPYIVMEYLSEGTLKDLIDFHKDKKELVDIALLKTLTSQLFEGIAAINEILIHRDLKPDNILMDGAIPKIADFGLSKIVDAATRSNTFKGQQHICYMAPEAWKKEKNEVQIDMYAMGLVLFELATGNFAYELPTDSFNFDSFRKMHMFSAPKAISDFRSDLPDEFGLIISKLLEKNPNDRFKSWGETIKHHEQSWSSSGQLKNDDDIQKVIKGAGDIHEFKTTIRLEKKREQEALVEATKLDFHQKHYLLERLNKIIETFNEKSLVGNMTIVSGDRYDVSKMTENDMLRTRFAIKGFTYEIKIPDCANSVFVKFFWVDPALSLRCGTIRFAAQVHDQYNGGFNYLLVRNDEEDLYGQWRVCHCRHNAFSSRHGTYPVEPFGFNAADIAQIQRADRAAHIYTTVFSDELSKAFTDLIVAAMQRDKDNT